MDENKEKALKEEVSSKDDEYSLLVKRFNEAIFGLGPNLTDVARKYNVSYSTLTKWTTGVRKPRIDKMMDIFGINPSFLKYGKYPIFVEENSLSNHIDVKSNAHEVVAEPREYYGGIEFWLSAANAGKSGKNDFEGSFIVNHDMKRSYKASYKQVRVTGESMEPSIPDGWIVTFDTGLTPDHKDVVVATSADSLVVKRFKQINGKYYLTSDNPNYEDILIDENVTIHGVVIEFFKY